MSNEEIIEIIKKEINEVLDKHNIKEIPNKEEFGKLVLKILEYHIKPECEKIHSELISSEYLDNSILLNSKIDVWNPTEKGLEMINFLNGVYSDITVHTN